MISITASETNILLECDEINQSIQKLMSDNPSNSDLTVNS